MTGAAAWVTLGWGALAVWCAVLAVRMALTEAVWTAHRVQAGPRRVVRALDAALVVLAAALVVCLAAVIGPALLG